MTSLSLRPDRSRADKEVTNANVNLRWNKLLIVYIHNAGINIYGNKFQKNPNAGIKNVWKRDI